MIRMARGDDVPDLRRESRAGCLLPRIERERPQREIRRVEMVPEVEDLWKAGARPVLVLPGSVVLLQGQQILDALPDRLGIAVPGGKERHQGPRGLGRGGGPLALGFGLVVTPGQLAAADV